jgi:hypothetical protein
MMKIAVNKSKESSKKIKIIFVSNNLGKKEGYADVLDINRYGTKRK